MTNPQQRVQLAHLAHADKVNLVEPRSSLSLAEMR
jgi:hypothetical protein